MATKRCDECGELVDAANLGKSGVCHICRCDYDYTGTEDQVTAIGRIGRSHYTTCRSAAGRIVGGLFDGWTPAEVLADRDEYRRIVGE